MNPYGSWSGLVVGLMGMLAKLTGVRERSGELRHSYPYIPWSTVNGMKDIWGVELIFFLSSSYPSCI